MVKVYVVYIYIVKVGRIGHLFKQETCIKQAYHEIQEMRNVLNVECTCSKKASVLSKHFLSITWVLA